MLLAVFGEYLLLGNGTLRYFGVGLIEEAAKLVALWLLGAVLFSAARQGRLRFAPVVAATYLFVALLHALYDSSSGIGALIVGLLSGDASYWRVLLAGQIPVQLANDLTLFTIASFACTCVVSLVGICAMRRLWRRATGPALP
jgi:protease PrsW